MPSADEAQSEPAEGGEVVGGRSRARARSSTGAQFAPSRCVSDVIGGRLRRIAAAQTAKQVRLQQRGSARPMLRNYSRSTMAGR